MVNSVPVASNLLESKFLGFSVRRLGESLLLPLAPCAVLYTLGFPLLLTFPLFVGGVVVGGTIYLKTPSGQKPLAWTQAVIAHRTRTNVYTWSHPEPTEHDLANSVIQDDWVTQPTPGEVDSSGVRIR